MHTVKGLPLREELDLRLGRVDIDVHRMGWHLHMEDTGGKFPHHQLVPICLLQRRLKELGLHRSAIDKEDLIRPAGPGLGGLGDEPLHPAALPVAVHRDQVGRLPAVNAGHGRQQPPIAGGIENLLPIPEQADRHLGMGQGLALHGGGNGRPLYAVLLHKFHPGRGVEKEVPDHDGGPLRASGLRLGCDFPRLQVEAGPFHCAGRLGQQVHPGHCGNGRQSLSPEAHGADGVQILRLPELGGGVAEKRGSGILPRHAAAVIRYPEEGHAAVAQLHRHLGGPGVHCVFQQLLHHRSRALHHLACGNQIGHMGGKLYDFRHFAPPHHSTRMDRALTSPCIRMGAKMVSAFS